MKILFAEYLSLLYFIEWIYADEFHVVSPGPCLPEGDAYCTRRVANSMCSLEKNECFCKSGYVSIQESYGITCKTLLTNLKCQVDSDCTHVINSACHPGAGYCACPGGTIYVPQDHACRQSAENNQNQFCLKCRQVNGVCYHYPSQITNTMAMNRYRRYEYKNHDLVPFISPIDTLFKQFPEYTENVENYGCSCPHNTGMLASVPIMDSIKANHNHSKKHHRRNFNPEANVDIKMSALSQQQSQSFPQWYFCKAMLVDIWEYCNHIDLLCRARNAHCVKMEGGSDLIRFSCQCISGYIPVYQKHLNYYECFHQLEENHSNCDSCIHSNGKCYTMNEQSTDSSIGCLCPNNLRSTLTQSSSHINILHHTNNQNVDNSDRGETGQNTFTALLPQVGLEYETCGENLVHVFCQRHLLEICFLPISRAPYQNLAENLQLRRSVAFITNLTFHQKIIDTCTLDSRNNALQKKQLNRTVINQVKIDPHQVWCRTVDWRQDSSSIPCGLSITEYMSGHLYTGYLAVVTNQEHRNQESDLLFQFTCKTNNDVPHRVPGQVFQRSIETEKSDFFKDPPWPKLDVKLSIKDENGQSVQTILESTSVRFEAELVDELNIYKAVIVEECYMIDKIESGQRNEGSKETLLLYKGCPMLKAELKEKSSVGFNFHKNHYDNEQALIFRSTDNLHYLQTGLFRLYPNYSPMSVDGQTKTNTRNASSTFTHDRTAKLTFEKINSVDETYKRKLNEIGHRLHELKFTCTFRVCKQLAWCSWPSVCDSTMSSLNNPRITFLPPSLRIIQRSVPLYLIESVPSSHLPVKKQATSKVCGELFCSNTLHIVLMMGLVGVLTCLMGVMGMLLARKYRQRLNQTRTSVIRNKSKMKHSKHYHCSQHSEINSHLTKSYDNPISQSVTSQHLLHQQYQKPHQQSENDTLKSLLKADNGIHTNDNSNTIHQAYAVDIKDCCKYWLNEHSYANPLLLQKSPNDLSQCHQHHYTHLCQQQHQQQMSSSSTVATPTHCSCLSEIIFNDSKNIQNSHNYYTFKHYTTLPTTTFTPLNSTSFLKDEEFPIMNRTTTFILEPTNTSISTNSVTNNNNNNGNIHEFITTTYPTTLINNHNHSILYCSEHLNDCHDSTVPQYHHSYAQKQRHCEQEQYREFGDSNNDNDSNLKNKHSVNNQSEISLKEYNKLANLTDTVYFGVDYHNSNYATNPLDLTVCTKGVQQEQTPSHVLQQSVVNSNNNA